MDNIVNEEYLDGLLDGLTSLINDRLKGGDTLIKFVLTLAYPVDDKKVATFTSTNFLNPIAPIKIMERMVKEHRGKVDDRTKYRQ